MKDAGNILFVIYAAPIAYNHGVAVLSSLLKEAGFSTNIFIANGWNLDEFKLILKHSVFRSVCFAHCIKKDFDLSLPYIKISIDSGVETLLGGTFHRRNNPNEFDGLLKICRGDGENIVNYFLNDDTSVFDEQQVCKDLDSLPMADYELFEHIRYDGHIKGFKDCYKLPYTVSRGCIGKCKFCEVRYQSPGVRIRHKSMDDIEILNRKYDPDMWFFTDELFPYHNKKFMENFLNRIDRPFFIFMRADIDPIILKLMIDRGLSGCAFGVESGDEKYRNEVLGKDLTDDQIYRTANILTNNDVYFAHFYMIHTGELETFKTRLKTEKMSRELGGVPMVFDFTKVSYQTRC